MKNLPLVRPTDNLHDAMSILNAYGKGIALVVDAERRLLGTLTDGDFRRALLDSPDLERPVSALLDLEKVPLVAAPGHEDGFLLELMRRKSVRQIPITDIDGRVVDLVTMDELAGNTDPVQAVIMAGGRGERLRPLTDNCPKPMLPINGKPLLECTVERLRQAGIRRVHIATRYLSEQIVEHFGNGDSFGVDMAYVRESEPLGTAGSLGLMAPAEGLLLILNGDVHCELDYQEMLAYHRTMEADLTVAQAWWEFPVPYGVLRQTKGKLKEIIEKPIARVPVNAGVYLLESYVQHYMPPRPIHMTQVADVLRQMGRTVAIFPRVGRWIDIGNANDYARAQEVR